MRKIGISGIPPDIFLFLRTMSQADAKHRFDECREGQKPRSSAVLQA